jgi:hypothetical protein
MTDSTAITYPSKTNSEYWTNSSNVTARMVVAMDREWNKTRKKTKNTSQIFPKQSTFVPRLTIMLPLDDEIAFSHATFYLNLYCCLVSHLSGDILKNILNRKNTDT